eukprot:CAMPEP_0196592442 /NCGR_PEP_ID=MMETSP1081-20130531/72778_1 /TAXON_ID=36882 /ORGANISM="Pyramimonas amylifera, Strain CCMP720" /LENGTH=42 /DNA_ID= /DNA_START= /DNA_END= /DNA_ORIENTATION=
MKFLRMEYLESASPSGSNPQHAMAPALMNGLKGLPLGSIFSE